MSNAMTEPSGFLRMMPRRVITSVTRRLKSPSHPSLVMASRGSAHLPAQDLFYSGASGCFIDYSKDMQLTPEPEIRHRQANSPVGRNRNREVHIHGQTFVYRVMRAVV